MVTKQRRYSFTFTNTNKSQWIPPLFEHSSQYLYIWISYLIVTIWREMVYQYLTVGLREYLSCSLAFRRDPQNRPFRECLCKPGQIIPPIIGSLGSALLRREERIQAGPCGEGLKTSAVRAKSGSGKLLALASPRRRYMINQSGGGSDKATTTWTDFDSRWEWEEHKRKDKKHS